MTTFTGVTSFSYVRLELVCLIIPPPNKDFFLATNKEMVHLKKKEIQRHKSHIKGRLARIQLNSHVREGKRGSRQNASIFVFVVIYGLLLQIYLYIEQSSLFSFLVLRWVCVYSSS